MSLMIVSTATELKEALSRASDGDRIELKSGDYGDLFLRDIHFNSEVVIAAQDPTDPPVFDSLQLWKVDHLTFDGMTFDYVPDDTTLEWSAAVRGDLSTNVKILNSTVEGGVAVVGTDPDAEAGTQGNQGIIGFPVGVGIMFNGSQNVTIENTVISAFTKGATFQNTDGIQFNDNETFAIRKVPFATGNTNDVHIEGNYFHDITPWKFGGLGDHGDHIHIVTTTQQTAPNENIVIRDNYFAQGDGEPVLGIYLDDNDNDQGFRNVLIENNVLHNNNAQGIRLEDVVGGIVRNNTLLQSDGDAVDAPRIQLHNGTRDVTVVNNITAAVVNYSSLSLDASGNVVRDNLLVQRHEPQSNNYVGDLFSNALSAFPALEELRVLPGSAAEGFGAMVKMDGGVTGYISDTRGENFEINHHDFDLRMIEVDGLQVTPQNATVIWDFGDGNNDSGLQTSHTYSYPGMYDTTATITLANGNTYTLHKTIQVLTPVALTADFDDGTVSDHSAIELDAQIIGNVQLVETDNGKAIRLSGDGAALKFEGTEELIKNSDFTISMAFRKDNADDVGHVLNFSGTASIYVLKDGITLRGQNSDAQPIVLTATKIGLDDTDWHQVTYTYSQKTGTATLYIDGAEVANVDGMTGIQHTTGGHGLHLGNPWGASLDGLFDDVSFLRGALNADQVAEHYDAFTSGETSQFVMVADQPQVQGSAGDDVSDDTPTDPDRDGDEAAVRPDVPVFVTDDSTAADAPTPPVPSGFIFDQATDQLHLGRLKDFEDSQQLSFSVEYSNSDATHAGTRLVWNEGKVGIVLKGDGVVLLAATEDEGFKQFAINGLGLDDAEVHRLTMNLDADEDRLQLFVDDKMVFEDTQSNFELVETGGREFGWHLGSLWGTEFQGSILNFDAIDKFSITEDASVEDNGPGV